MAIIHCTSKTGSVIDLHVKIYDDKNDIKETNYSVSNNMITQKLSIKNRPITTRINFPIEFKQYCMSVFVNTDEFKQLVYFNNINKSGCDVTVLPNKYPESTIIKLAATGY